MENNDVLVMENYEITIVFVDGSTTTRTFGGTSRKFRDGIYEQMESDDCKFLNVNYEYFQKSQIRTLMLSTVD